MSKNLKAVKTAIRQGDKRRARKLLVTILKQNPTADAWYIAARLASDRKQAAGFLRRALRQAPDHVPSKKLLTRLSQKPPKAKIKMRYVVGGVGVLVTVAVLFLVVAITGSWAPAEVPGAITATYSPITTSTETPTSTHTGTTEPDWERFEAGDMSIWLPTNFEGGNTSQDLGLIIESLRSLGPEYEEIARTIQYNSAAFTLWAFDSNSSANNLTNVVITNAPYPAGYTLEDYVALSMQQIPVETDIIEQERTIIDGHPTIRLVVHNTMTPDAKQLIYVIKVGEIVWSVTYTTGANEFDARLPIFEQSIDSFTLIP